ncbi:hypothetical protein DITRI_Ditri20bG0036100 [Diplodiscus trichospermus]
MAYENYEYFRTSGPSHLTSVDWNNEHHRRCVAASLVRGVHVLEVERQAGRRGSQSLAHHWWEFFHFKLILDPLIDNDDGSIFGAIFRYSPPAYSYHRTIDRSPRFVIAFRGTLMKLDSFETDLKLDIKIIKNGLHRTTRFAIAMKAVQDLVTVEGGSNLWLTGHSSNLWLTGHSLGAAIAMLIGRTMAKAGKFLEAFLFNPPYISLPVHQIIKDKKVRDGLRFAGTAIKLGIVAAATAYDKNNKQRKRIGNEDTFAAISGWIPCLFVNQKDPLCSGYIGYIEHRKKLQDRGGEPTAMLTRHISLTNLALSEAGIKGVETSKPLHLLPSANLTVNRSPSKDFFRAHKLCQWWRHDLNLKSSVYEYK